MHITTRHTRRNRLSHQEPATAAASPKRPIIANCDIAIAICDGVNRRIQLILYGFRAAAEIPDKRGYILTLEKEDPMSWNLISQSFAILRKDKKLVLFPILSALGVVALAIAFISGLTGAAPWHASDLRWSGPSTWIWLFLWYCASSFAIVFFNCALAACAQIRFSGGEPSIADGMRQAGSRVGSIFLWSAITSTVGLMIRAIEQRAGWIGKAIALMFGFGWTLATYLIVPVLVLEDLNVVDSIRRSGRLLKETWGEQLVVGLHFMWMGLLLAIPGLILGVLSLPVGMLYFAALTAVLTAARQIFVVALYRFAVSGEAPAGYSNQDLGGFFRSR
jgi:hypothetical protein